MASVMRFESYSRDDGGRAERGTQYDSSGERLVAFRRRAAAEQAHSLNKLIESEIIPRLLVAHATPTHPFVEDAHGGEVSAAEVAAFAPLTLQVEADELLEHVQRLVARGVPFETLLVDLIAPAARELGEYWDADRCDFVDVTMGLWRLQEVVHELSQGAAPACSAGAKRHALFASLAGDQHSLGTVVIEELFAANGWSTDRLGEASCAELAARVRDDWFDLAGLTITCDCHIGPLPQIVRAIRAASRNPRICVMVGGRPFVADPGLAAAIGADGTAPDARVALRVAGELVATVAQESVVSMTG